MLKTAFIALLLIHGIIHIIGFLAAFNLAQFNQFSGKTIFALTNTGVRFLGFMWLLVLLLFMVTSAGYIFNKQWWWAPGLVAIVLSQALIITYWKDARAGTIANVLILLPLIVAYANNTFYKKAQWEAKQIIPATVNNAEIVTEDMLTGLPACVQNWLRHSGVVGKDKVHTVYLKQEGYMCIKPGGKWMPAVAEQYFNTDSPAFVWTVKVDMMPGVQMTGRDRYADGHGNMLIKLYSLFTFADGKGDRIDQGTMLRYLGEICWFPSAALQPYIQWKEIDANSAHATMSYKGVTASAIFTFDKEGRLTATNTDRYMGMGNEATLEKWYIPVTEWKTFHGVEIPSKGNAIWHLKAGDYDYYRWEITGIKYNIAGVNPSSL